MTKIVSILTLATVAAFSGVAILAQDVRHHCSSATIAGDYAFRVSGAVFTPAGIVNRDGVALTHFDGNHGLTQNDYVLANGVPVARSSEIAEDTWQRRYSNCRSRDCQGAVARNCAAP